MTSSPSPNGSNGASGGGRDAGGRFARGNPGGPGNPHAAHVARLRSALLDAVTPEDVQAVAAALLAQAKQGDVMAVRELLNRLLGQSPVSVKAEVSSPVAPIAADVAALKTLPPEELALLEKVLAKLEAGRLG
ncbi:MAG: hypothetical protein WD042_05120 [Phycisphaeraceae bacterium]